MKRNASINGEMQAQLDRLVAGELADHERAQVLVWLDTDPWRWRDFGLAFLEAQLWESAMATAANQPKPDAVTARQQRPMPTASVFRRRSPASFLALAVIVAAAFLVGLAVPRPHLRDALEWPATAKQPDELQVDGGADGVDDPQIATVAVRSNLVPQVPLLLQLPITQATRDSSDTSANSDPLMSDYERQQWERRGFEVVEERRYLPARLPDGRQVVVPVNQVRFRFKGTPLS